MRVTVRLWRQLPALTSPYRFSSSSPAVYSIGVSYAGKDSPPFVAPGSKPSRTGFGHLRAHQGGQKIREWVQQTQKIRAGRGELDGSVVGGWRDDVQERVRAWGAGEDFFAVEVPNGPSSDTYLPDQPNPPSSLTHLAISDGVGGWSDTVDPSFFSQALMYYYAQDARANRPDSTPLQHLSQAYKGVLKEEVVVAGGATACAVSLGKDGALTGVNLGDSGCSVIREGRIVFSTPSLTHYFNCPKQLSKIPSSMAASGIITDQPETSSDTFTAQLRPGDVILLYTDGLSDNVPSTHFPLLLSHIQQLLNTPDNAHLQPLDRAQELARLYADVLVAYGRSAMTRTGEELEEVDGDGEVRESWKTPFEVEARKEGLKYLGGKVDDITVITAVVSELNPEEE